MNPTFPQITAGQLQERMGVYAVAMLVTAMECVWRETPNSDVGIDGHIEFVEDPGHTKGRLVAAQIKSGRSYFGKSDKDNFYFKAAEKHCNYWMAYPIPVMLILFDPDAQIAYWAEVRQQLRSPFSADERVLRIPKAQKLLPECRPAFFQTTGPIEGEYLDLPLLVHTMSQQRSCEYMFDLSFLELFWLGLTDSGRKVFFSMNLCMEIAEYRSHKDQIGGVGVGAFGHDFLDRYIEFLFSQGLVYFDYCDYLIDREELRLQPIMLMPLSPRGFALAKEIYDRIEAFKIAIPRREFLLAVTEQFVDSIPDHLACLDEFCERLRAKGDSATG